jgi:hypothetical protein
MDWQNETDRLILDVAMGLKRHKYSAPRKVHDCIERDRYYNAVAVEIVKQLTLSWTFSPKGNLTQA